MQPTIANYRHALATSAAVNSENHAILGIRPEFREQRRKWRNLPSGKRQLPERRCSARSARTCLPAGRQAKPPRMSPHAKRPRQRPPVPIRDRLRSRTDETTSLLHLLMIGHRLRRGEDVTPVGVESASGSPPASIVPRSPRPAHPAPESSASPIHGWRWDR